MSVKKRLNRIMNNKVFKTIFLVLLVFVFSFLVADVALATNWAVKILGGIISAIVYMLGWVLMLVVRVLVYVAQYNNFIRATPIKVGWIMVRDLANMFFIVILLIIAFATILRIEKYNYKKWLPKLLLMAVLINFSKTICGLLIDVAQVVMLSFVNSFKGIGNYNFTTLLGIDSLGQFKGVEANDSNWDIMAAYGLMLVYTVISLVVMIAMTAMLVMRIVMIWVYVVLSPLAFLLGAFPDGQSYASKWWTQFSQNLIIGPVLAFFIWLSFMTVDPNSKGYQILEINGQNLEGSTEGQTMDGLDDRDEVKDVGTADTLLRFVVAIAMLLGGLKVSQEIGGAAGNALGKVSQKGFALSKQYSKQLGKKTAIGSAKLAGRSSLGFYAKTSKYLEEKGILKEGKKLPGSEFAGKWREDIKNSRTKKRVENRAAFLQKIGMGEQAGEHLATTLKEKHPKSFKITQQAATKISSESKLSREFNERLKGDNGVEALSKLSAKSVYDIETGYTGLNKTKAIKTLNDPDTLKTYTDWADNKDDKGYYGDQNDKDKVESILAAIEATEKDNKIGSTTTDQVQILKNKLEQKKSEETKPYSRTEEVKQKEVKSRDDEFKKTMKDLTEELKKIVSGGGGSTTPPPPNYRLATTGAEAGVVSEGKLAVSSFGGKNKEDVVGLDFSELQAKGLNFRTDALGANINKNEHGSLMQEVARHLIDKISNSQLGVDRSRDELDEKFEKGDISQETYTKEQKNLDHKQEYLSQAKTRLKDGDYESLNLVNTAHPSNTRDEKLQTAYHEKIHSEGVEDEYITESIAKGLMKKGLYGRNKETGNRHVSEIAQMAKQMQDDGVGESDIVKQVNQEIENRSKSEAPSRADRVLKKEKGDLPTETQDLAELGTKDYDKMSTDELQKVKDVEKEKSDLDIQHSQKSPVENIIQDQPKPEKIDASPAEDQGPSLNNLIAKKNLIKGNISKTKKSMGSRAGIPSLVRQDQKDLDSYNQELAKIDKQIKDLESTQAKQGINPQNSKRSYNPEASFNLPNQGLSDNQASQSSGDEKMNRAPEQKATASTSSNNQSSVDVKLDNNQPVMPEIRAEIDTSKIDGVLKNFESSLGAYFKNQKSSNFGEGFSSEDQNKLLLQVRKSMLIGNAKVIKSINHFTNTNNFTNKKVTLAVIKGMLKDMDLEK